MEKLFSIAFAVLWSVAIAYVVVFFVSAIVKGLKRLKHRKVVVNGTGTTRTSGTSSAGNSSDE